MLGGTEMELIKTENLTFTYPNTETPALRDLSFSIQAGEFVTLCGPSGCGKSTLLRQLKPILSPFGAKSGTVFFDGRDIAALSQREQSEKIGFVMQSPDSQIVTDKVWHELAFGLESLSCPTPEIRARVAEMASFFGIQTWFHKKTNELSGGQKQLLNLASVMVMQPSVLILDEPTAQLDPIAAQDFLETLSKINRELGTTVILTEHRLEEAFPLSDRVIVMENGAISAMGTPREVGKRLKQAKSDMCAALPTPMRVHFAVPSENPCPITVREGKKWLEDLHRTRPLNKNAIPEPPPRSDSEPQVSVQDVWFRYEKNLPDVVKGLSFHVNKGEFYAIVGGNGTGKTTALSLVASLLAPYRGKIETAGSVSMLPQNPAVLFTQKTVAQDLSEMPFGEQALQTVISVCELEDLLSKHPYDLSGGEQQRAALAKVLLTSPDILLLDEPTKGLDAHFKEKLANILQTLQKGGITIIMVSHDIEFCAKYADRCGMFFDGTLVSEDTPRKFFSGKSFYTTAANRMARTLLPEAVLAEDIIAAAGGKAEEQKEQNKRLPEQKKPPKKENTATVSPRTANKDRKKNRQTLLAALMVFLAVPLTIYIGLELFGNRKYYFISLLILLETLLPFAVLFEKRKPKARFLVTISVLCALAVAGRVAFYMLPQFKPMVALIILAGVAFGGETGFFVGAMTGFVSNFFFGQGPWTPFQMFALGIIGFLAGVLFYKGALRKTKTALCIFGGLATFMIYGGILNPASVLMAQGNVTLPMILSSYLFGLPFDLIHATSTVFFLWVISEPMLEKLGRIKTKYGLMDDAHKFTAFC